MNTIELQKGDWVRLKPGLILSGNYGSIVLFDFMVFSGIKQIEEEVRTQFGLTIYRIDRFYYSKEMLEIVAKYSYSDHILPSAIEIWEGFKSYSYDPYKVLYNSDSATVSKEKDDESSSLNLVVNKNKKKIHLNFKQ